MRLGLIAIVCFTACGGEPSSRTDIATVADVAADAVSDTTASDTTVADVATATATTDVVTTDATGDVSDAVLVDADVDAGPATYSLACGEGASCVLPCARGTCVDGLCRFDAPRPGGLGCVVPEASDPTRGACVAAGAGRPDAPGCFFCNPAVSAEGFGNIAFTDGFEAGGADIEVERLVQNPVTWSLSTARAATGTHSLYFGDPTLLSYDVGERAAAIARTRSLAVPEGIELALSFQLWAETEETPGFDRLRVLVVPHAGEPREVWSSDALGGTTHGVFVPVTIALGPVGAGDHVAFEADSIDGIINGFEGFYLDDLRIATTCCEPDAEPGAGGSSDCDDGDLCTTDRCVANGAGGGACGHEPIAGCCLSDAHCDDGDPCTEDRCSGPGGTCVATSIPGCCATTGDCDDGDPCTEDRCGDGACGHAPICCATTADCDDGDPCTSATCDAGQCRYVNACCRDDSDCDDALACTDDRCKGGVCQNAFTYAPGCCIPDVMTERFDALATPQNWTLPPLTNNVGWQVVSSAEARSEPGILYYGHKTLHFYETGGRNAGTAVSPFVRLPDGVALTLSFDILADVEASATRDVLTIEVLVGGALVPLVTKADLTLNAWQEVSLDLSWAAGEIAQLRFGFDTIDGVANTRRGLFIDDVRILSSCLPQGCGSDAECPGPASMPGSCLRGACEDGTCHYGGACP